MNHILELKNVSKSYANFSLGPLNLSLPCGCIMGLIGENGAGKSTTLQLMLDMIPKDGGCICLFGQEISTGTPTLKEDVGIVLEDIGFPDCLSTKQINRMMSYTYHNWDERFFWDMLQRLSVPLDRLFKDFSQGMKMKLGIAIALSHHPKLLILDEATNGLDPIARDEVLDILNEFTRDEAHSVLLSSHIVSDLEKICDYVAFLHQGKLLLFEEKDRLLERYGMIHVSQEELQKLNPWTIKGKRISPYGIDVMVDCDKISSQFLVHPINMEDLFIFMTKEEKEA